MAKFDKKLSRQIDALHVAIEAAQGNPALLARLKLKLLKLRMGRAERRQHRNQMAVTADWLGVDLP